MNLRTLSIIACFAAGSALSSHTSAASAGSKYVDDVNLSLLGMAAKIRVENVSVDKHVSKVNLKAKDNALKFNVSNTVHCNPGIGRKFIGGYMNFGPVSLRGGNLDSSLAVYSKSVDTAYTLKKNDIAEHTPITFSVPLSKVKNAQPNLRVDPVAEINKKLQQHLQGGGNAVDFYKQSHTVVLQRPITASGICGTNTKNSGGYDTKNHTIQIEYIADPKVHNKAKLNASMAGNMPNQIGNNLPFKLDKATFQNNIPHHIGKCIPNKNPKIRINFQVSGAKQGLIDLRVVQVGSQYAHYGTYFEKTGIKRNPQQGGGHLDFQFPLKEMLSQQKYSYMTQMVNETFNHNMRIEARYKNARTGQWSQYKPYGTATFKHRCTPQLNPSLGTQNQIKGFDNKPKPEVKPIRALTPQSTRPERKSN